MEANQRPPVLSGEKLLRGAPRWLELVCIGPLVMIAFMLFHAVVLYVRFNAYYGRNLKEKALDWGTTAVEMLIATSLLGLAVNLMRGTSRRADGGLFSPVALRIWGVVFLVTPLVITVFAWKAIFHAHQLFLWCFTAAVACFLLASRRKARDISTGTTAKPID
jgi:hypothetical protein